LRLRYSNFGKPNRGDRHVERTNLFLTTWLHFDDTIWVPKDEQLKRTLVIVTFDESEGNIKPERIFAAYNHYSVLRTIEENFGLDPIHKESGDGTASVITGVWK